MLSYSSFLTQHSLLRPLNLLLSLLPVTLVHQHVPAIVQSFFPLHTGLLPAALPALFCQPQNVLALCWTFVSSISSWFQAQSCPCWRLVVTFPGFAQLNSWFFFSFCSHRQIISADLESPREQHIGKLDHCLGFLMFLCVPLLTTQSS